MTNPAPFRQPDSPLSYERFDVYRVALEFQALVPALAPGRGHGSLRDQLYRASTSILLNVAEGCGRSLRGEKASFYSLLVRVTQMLTRLILRMQPCP